MRHLTRTNEEKRQLASEICDYLNEIREADPDALQRLVGTYVRCNDRLMYHSTTQVDASSGKPMVGLLGIINGLIGVDESQWGYVAAIFDDADGHLEGFRVRDGSIKVVSTPKAECLVGLEVVHNACVKPMQSGVPVVNSVPAWVSLHHEGVEITRRAKCELWWGGVTAVTLRPSVPIDADTVALYAHDNSGTEYKTFKFKVVRSGPDHIISVEIPLDIPHVGP